MNLQQLYYFRKLAELQHYTKAAKELYITQPSLSDSISSLEQELGIPLFQKEGRNIKLTKYGREFYEHVFRALNELEMGISLMKDASGQISGTVDIGCIPTLLGNFLPSAINNYKKKNRLARFNVYHGMSMEVARGVAEGRYDIGFCSMVDNEPDLVFVPIIAQELIVIVNKEHPLADRKELRLEELKDFQLTTYRETLPIGKVIRKLLNEHQVTAAFSYDDEISIGGIVSESQLAAIVARTPFLREFDNLVYIRLPDVPEDTRLLYMTYSRKNFVSAAVSNFANYIVAHEMKLPR